MTDDDILKFPDRKKSAGDGPLQIVRDSACLHRRTLVNLKAAEVTCADCNEKLSPMWVLHELAAEDSRLRWEWSQLRAALALMRAKTKTKCRHCGKLTPIPLGVSSWSLHEEARKHKFEATEQ